MNSSAVCGIDICTKSLAYSMGRSSEPLVLNFFDTSNPYNDSISLLCIEKSSVFLPRGNPDFVFSFSLSVWCGNLLKYGHGIKYVVTAANKRNVINIR